MRLVIILTALGLLIATACSGPGVVSAEELGSAWPLREDKITTTRWTGSVSVT